VHHACPQPPCELAAAELSIVVLLALPWTLLAGFDLAPAARSKSSQLLSLHVLGEPVGMSDAMAQGMTDMAWAKNEGLDNAVQRTPENSTPTSFYQWCVEVLKPAVVDQAESTAS
jgi:hypothetical protein